MSNEIVTYNLNQPSKALEVANVLQQFVKEKKLTANIKGKEYPLVEAWQFAGSQLGLYPILTETTNLTNEKEIKYQAIVEVRRIEDDRIMSRGVAICSNKEFSKKQFDEYAILSMAQTRAEGKAYRMLLSWLMKAAGFEATPAEEMDFNQQPAAEREKPSIVKWAESPDHDFSNVPDEGERHLLRQLVYTSDLTNEEKEAAMTAIDFCTDYKVYQKIQDRLEVRQAGIDQIQNPSQKDINKHLKKSVQ